MTARIAAIAMAALLALYLVFVASYAIRLMTSGEPVGIAMGVALFVLPVIGAWALIAELVFGVRTQRLYRIVRAEGDVPADGLRTLASGRPDPRQADEQFGRYKAAVEADPDSWKAWFRLGLAYDASGDRRRARWATREAVKLSRPTRPE